ncbi:MAG: hypothetical protein GX221_02745 [Candidatus Riflebacteria bacterium]|nr:hypothetical protein [Candidatus Riflebacteria bacterium]
MNISKNKNTETVKIFFNLNLIALSFFFLFCSPCQAQALSPLSRATISAFGRQETFLKRTLKELKTLDEKLKTALKEKDKKKISDIVSKVEQKIQLANSRYSNLEALYTSSAEADPIHQAEIFTAFSTAKSAYVELQNFYYHEIKGKAEEEKIQKASKKSLANNRKEKEASSEKHETTPDKSEGDKQSETDSYFAELGTQIDRLLEKLEQEKTSLPAPNEKLTNLEKLRVTGDFSLLLAKNDETENIQGLIPPFKSEKTLKKNEFGKLKLSLEWDLNPETILIFKEDFQAREKYEKTLEHFTTLALQKKVGNNSYFVLSDDFQRTDYPSRSYKNFKNNLVKATYIKESSESTYSASAGIANRRYDRTSITDFDQLIFKATKNTFKENSSSHIEYSGDITSYKNLKNLDHSQHNLYLENTRTFAGNQAVLDISNYATAFISDNPEPALYRDSYFNNSFQLAYSLPITEMFYCTFEGDSENRRYKNDNIQGYHIWSLFGEVVYRPSAKHSFTVSSLYICDEENFEKLSHDKYEYSGIYEARLSDKLYFTFENIFRKRIGNMSLTGMVMDFGEDEYGAKFSYNILESLNISLEDRFLCREYTFLWYPDYKHNSLRIIADYSPAPTIAVFLSAGVRDFSFKNYDNQPTPWAKKKQPIMECTFNKRFSDDVSINAHYSYEKTWKKNYDFITKELTWDFRSPVTNQDFLISLDVNF